MRGYSTGVEFPYQEVFEPYLIGFWLGDGTASLPGITTQDAVIIKYLKEIYDCWLSYQNKYHYRINGIQN